MALVQEIQDLVSQNEALAAENQRLRGLSTFETTTAAMALAYHVLQKPIGLNESVAEMCDRARQAFDEHARGRRSTELELAAVRARDLERTVANLVQENDGLAAQLDTLRDFVADAANALAAVLPDEYLAETDDGGRDDWDDT